ncbi:fructosamine kinase family protein [Kordiimonas aquimaris]|uniref:fructosamine kinase family protein n=1 Tax=Kordiimonas aquimaris TaxID=707591 RepID=UPI0021D071DC|nr:fructosamine kinase family protein [Kordiimonas aquimaris]
MSGAISHKIEQALNAKIMHAKPLAGGDIADVSCLTLSDGRFVVAKRPRIDQPDTTASEKMMLKHLASSSKLPVPDVLFQTKGVLIISHIENTGMSTTAEAAEGAAIHISALHASQPKGKKTHYGLNKDTFIGPLPQQNQPTDNWVDFFRDRRLMAMATSCLRTQRMPPETMKRIENLSERLSDLIPAQPTPSLLHGDLWAGNMLFNDDKVAGFIDPAISYGHHEMDLAFIALMGGLHENFFSAYSTQSFIDKGFHSQRCAVYQLWPLLVHLRIFGGSYLDQIHERLDELGF